MTTPPSDMTVGGPAAPGPLPDRADTPSRPSLRARMALSVALVAALAVWDDARESASALEDFAREQAALTQVTSAGLAAQLEVIRRDANGIAADALAGRPTPTATMDGYAAVRVVRDGADGGSPGGSPLSEAGLPLTVAIPDGRRVDLAVSVARLIPGSVGLERLDERVVLLLPPHARRFRTVDGRDLTSPVLRAALDSGGASMRLSRPESAALGLPPRTAMAGLARLDAGALGRWGVAVVTSAGRERDRDLRARWRVVLGVLVVAGLVGAFGSVALGNERREFTLARRLAASERERTREAELEREGHAANMVTLAAGIAHEISTPLGVIAGRAEQIADRLPPEDERAARCVRVILEQTQRIREVIQGLLHLARGGAPVLEPIDVSAVLTAAVDLVRHRFGSAGVDVVYLPDPEGSSIEGFVRGDHRLLEHAVVNLLLNACDACSRGGRVEVSPRVEPGRVVIAVADDGAGIAPAYAARVGEPFFSTKARGEGTGLGLAVTTEIVRIHRGELSLVPRRPRGTIATITLPTSTEDPSDAA